MERLKKSARKQGLWNLWLTLPYTGQGASGFSHSQYAVICEELGKSFLAPEATNCSAPDTGNMEVLIKYGTKEQQDKWLAPLLNGTARSAFAMTEPNVASSDGTNICTSITFDKDKDAYIVHGRKWWTSGAGDPRLRFYIVMGVTNPDHPKKHQRQSMIIVDAKSPGISLLRPMTIFGYDDAPHGHFEVDFDNVIVPKENLILGEGRGFEIAQGRLGPGRLHHCMRAIGAAEQSMSLFVKRITDPNRKTFGKLLYQHGKISSQLAECRIRLNAARLLVRKAAETLDSQGAKMAMNEIAQAKVYVPNAALFVMDAAIQAYGAAGVSQDTHLAFMYAMHRTLRIADGPDDVHLQTISRSELKSHL